MRNLVFVLSLFICAACDGSRHTVSQRSEESLRFGSEHLTGRTIQVPGGEAGLRIPLAGSLLPALPSGAAYTDRRGRATVTARIIRDTLYIDATCDSLQQVVWDYERLLSERSDVESVSERHVKRKSFASWLGLLPLLAALALICARRRKK